VVTHPRPRGTRLLVVALVSLSLAIITLDYREGTTGPLAEAGRWTQTAMAPLQEAVSRVTRPVGDFFSGLAHLPSLERENTDLKTQIAELQADAAGRANVEEQLQTLTDLLGLQQQLFPEGVAALVIANGVSNFEWSITIDRGSADGVQVDMPVVTGASDGPRLVGRVIRVTPISSVVQLIIDRNFAVAGKLSTSQEAGLVMGRGEDDLRMGHLRPGIQVSQTDPESVFTLGYEVNGQRGLYPPGLLIGTVSRAFSEPGSVESSVTIRPAVDFSTLQYVLVIARNPARPGEVP